MARIIRTIPTPRKNLSLRVVLSLLLFLQIQMPNAKDVTPAPSPNVTLKVQNHPSAHLALSQPQELDAEDLLNPEEAN